MGLDNNGRLKAFSQGLDTDWTVKVSLSGITDKELPVSFLFLLDFIFPAKY